MTEEVHVDNGEDSLIELDTPVDCVGVEGIPVDTGCVGVELIEESGRLVECDVPGNGDFVDDRSPPEEVGKLVDSCTGGSNMLVDSEGEAGRGGVSLMLILLFGVVDAAVVWCVVVSLVLVQLLPPETEKQHFLTYM